jgi:hypothetical protein
LGIASLVDTFHVPKLLSQQLLPFGRSGDGLEVLTFEVEQFSALSARRGRSASVWRTVLGLAVRRVFFVFLLSFAFDPWCFRVLVGRRFRRSACAGRTIRGCLADSPRAPRRRSVIPGASLEVLLPFRTVRGSGRTVRGKGADSPRYPAGQSVRPLRTVRPAWPDSPPEPGSFVPWFDSSLLLLCFRLCFKESFLRLEVDP